MNINRRTFCRSVGALVGLKYVPAPAPFVPGEVFTMPLDYVPSPWKGPLRWPNGNIITVDPHNVANRHWDYNR